MTRVGFEKTHPVFSSSSFLVSRESSDLFGLKKSPPEFFFSPKTFLFLLNIYFFDPGEKPNLVSIKDYKEFFFLLATEPSVWPHTNTQL